MKKNKNRGFLLVETLVVATFCITVLVMLFLQFRTLIVNYNDSYKYNTVEGIYKLNTIKKYLNQNGDTNNLNVDKYLIIGSNDACSNLPASFTNQTFCSDLIREGEFVKLIFSNNDTIFLKKDNINSYNISNGMKNFLKKLEVKNGKKRLVAEFKDGTFAAITYGTGVTVTPLNKDQTFVPGYYEYHTSGYSNSYVLIGNSYDMSSWVADPTTLNKTYYLAHDVDNTGKVTANYVCFIIDNTQYCLRGKNGTEGTVYWTQNKSVLEGLKNAGKITCSDFSNSNAICSATGLGLFQVNSYGYASVGETSHIFCSAYDGSYSRCYEE